MGDNERSMLSEFGGAESRNWDCVACGGQHHWSLLGCPNHSVDTDTDR